MSLILALTWPDYPYQRSLGGGITRFFRVFIKYCVFSLKCCVFSELCQFCCSAGVLPSWCVYTHWHQGKTIKVQNILKSLEKNTIFNEHPVYVLNKGFPQKQPLILSSGFSKEVKTKNKILSSLPIFFS